MISKQILIASALVLALMGVPSALAEQVPECMSGASAIPIDNQQVINWKLTSANQFHSRGHVLGTINLIFPDATQHHHFQISIGPDPEDTIEIVYNEGFGPTPQAVMGMTVEACGDYITSNAPGGGYAASPSGALIHWVHMSDNVKQHPSGFLVINGTVYGNQIGN